MDKKGTILVYCKLKLINGELEMENLHLEKKKKTFNSAYLILVLKKNS